MKSALIAILLALCAIGCRREEHARPAPAGAAAMPPIPVPRSTTTPAPGPATPTTTTATPTTTATTPTPTGVYYAESFDGATCSVVFPSRDAWEWGRPRIGPNAASSAPKVLSTRRDAKYPNQVFAICHTPDIDLSTARAPVLVFRHWYEFEDMYDGGTVSAKLGTVFRRIEPGTGYPRRWVGSLGGHGGFTGDGKAWQDAWFDLSAYAGRSDVRIAFEFGSDLTYNFDGWFIDDVMVAESSVIEATWGASRLAAAGACRTSVLAESFESAPSSQLARSLGASSQWELGAPSGKFLSWVPDGVHLAGTRLARDHDAGVSQDRMLTPFLDFAGARWATLRFASYVYAENGDDGGRVLASADGVTFVALTGLITGRDLGWTTTSLDLTPLLASLGPRFMIAFEFESDGRTNYDGWAIDDVEVLKE